MKISRHKRMRRFMNFYKNTFQFRSPFQILIDATFCHEALKSKINIREQVPKYLEDPEIKLFTTACVITEVELLGPQVFGAMLIAKQFKARRCGHEKIPISASECLLSMVANNNPDHYIVATQDRDLSEKCRLLPGVPLLYIKYNAVNLEKPSSRNIQTADLKLKETLVTSDYHTAVLKKLKTEAFGEDTAPKKKKRKIKGPNPLSCKKKKKKTVEQKVDSTTATKKRKRHKRFKGQQIQDVPTSEAVS